MHRASLCTAVNHILCGKYGRCCICRLITGAGGGGFLSVSTTADKCVLGHVLCSLPRFMRLLAPWLVDS